MGQTILDEYLAAWESTGIAPDPTAFGFDGLYSMLEECQDTMLKLGTAANDGKQRYAELETVLNGLAADKQRNEAAQYQRIVELEAQCYSLSLDHSRCREDAIRQAIADEEKIADLRAQLATLQHENAVLAGLALDEQNIFSYTIPLVDVNEQRAALAKLVDNVAAKRRMQEQGE